MNRDQPGSESICMLYSKISSYYDRIFPFNPAVSEFLSRYIRLSDTVLDFGCGTGTLTYEMSKRCSDIVGIDTSSDMILEARGKYPDLNFDDTDIDGVSDRHFDAVYSTGNTVSYFSREALQTLVRKIVSILSPGGYWIYQTVNWDFLANSTSYEFPVIQTDDILFTRRYTFPGSDITDFYLTLTPVSKPVLQETHRLYRLSRQIHLDTHLKTGFELVDCFLNWNGEPWSPDKNGATIMVFKNPFHNK